MLVFLEFLLVLFIWEIPSFWVFLIYFKFPIAQGNFLMESTLKCLRA